MLRWSDEGKAELKKVPGFVRGMAKKAVEDQVSRSGRNEVTAQDVRDGHKRHISFAEEKEGPKKTKIAVVRCETVAEVCPGVACLKSFNERHCHFADYGDDTEIIGFFTCGGCPGRRVSRMVDKLVDYGLEVVHLSSCMMLEGDYPKCPHRKQIKKNIESKGVRVIEGTHH